ncbi:MAG: hypothetical protein EOO93_05225 [Pedobacter sp.]|nr:MAG: hypothetical protein EOO93_05225 [Pedobacter sp.]
MYPIQTPRLLLRAIEFTDEMDLSEMDSDVKYICILKTGDVTHCLELDKSHWSVKKSIVRKVYPRANFNESYLIK